MNYYLNIFNNNQCELYADTDYNRISIAVVSIFLPVSQIWNVIEFLLNINVPIWTQISNVFVIILYKSYPSGVSEIHKNNTN